MDWREREKQKNREHIENDTYEKNGALYWSSCLTWKVPEERPVPMDCFADAGMVPPAGQKSALNEYHTRVLGAYREAQKNHVPSDEEKFEMLAAFGPGVEVVDVITGRKHRT